MEKYTKEDLWNIYIALGEAKNDPKNEQCHIIKKQTCDDLMKKTFKIIKQEKLNK